MSHTKSGRARESGESETIESVTVTDELLVSTSDAVKVKYTFYCFVSSFPAGENGNSQHRTDAVNTTLQKRAERDALHCRARLMEGGVGNSWSMSGFICPLWHTALWQLCYTQSSLKTVSLMLTRTSSSPHVFLSFFHELALLSFPLFPVLTLCLHQSLTPSGLPFCSIWLSHTSTHTCTAICVCSYTLTCTRFLSLSSRLLALLPSLCILMKIAPTQVTRS